VSHHCQGKKRRVDFSEKAASRQDDKVDSKTISLAKQSRLKRVNIDFTEEAASRQDDKVDSKKISFEKSYIY